MAFTFFFRDYQTLECIQEHVIPVLKTRRYMRIWDAGCAMGPEPFTLSIMLRENMGAFLFRNVKILATDIDNSNLFGKIIREGIYSREETGRIPLPLFEKYFTQAADKPGYTVINEEIRRSVEYLRHDLLKFQAPRTGFCLIVCKNVLLHFNREEQVKVIDMFADSLEPGGFLAMEQTQKMPENVAHKFDLVVSNAQLFQKVKA